MDDLFESFFEEIEKAELEELDINIDKIQFEIKDEGQANFFLRKVTELREEREKINKMCDDEVKRFVDKIETYRIKETATLDKTEEYFSSLLSEYASKQLEGTKKKSLKLPFGTLAFSKSPDSYVYETDAAMEFVSKEMPQFIRTKTELNKAELKKNLFVNESGEVMVKISEDSSTLIPGVTFSPGEKKFKIK